MTGPCPHEWLDITEPTDDHTHEQCVHCGAERFAPRDDQ